MTTYLMTKSGVSVQVQMQRVITKWSVDLGYHTRCHTRYTGYPRTPTQGNTTTLKRRQDTVVGSYTHSSRSHHDPRRPVALGASLSRMSFLVTSQPRRL